MFLRVTLAFLPLVISQALAFFTIKRRYDSLAWRESVAIVVTASVFAAIAIVGQVFHLPGDYAAYVLTCGLLSLPMIYILDAVTPLIVYYWTILNWAALEQSEFSALILFVLFAAGAAFVFAKRNQEGARLSYMTWITLITGFVAAFILGDILYCSLLLIVLCYFTLLLSVEDLPDSLHPPFKVIGLTGGLITLAVLTYSGMWEYQYEYIDIGGSLFVGGMLIAALFFTVKTFKRDKLKFSFLLSMIFVCVMRYCWDLLQLAIMPYEFIFMILSNLILLTIGIGFIVHGVRHTSLLTTNIGMTSVCTLIVMRFFDSEMDIFWRGVVFLALGTAFLLVNLKILRIKKRPQTGVEQ